MATSRFFAELAATPEELTELAGYDLGYAQYTYDYDPEFELVPPGRLALPALGPGGRDYSRLDAVVVPSALSSDLWERQQERLCDSLPPPTFRRAGTGELVSRVTLRTRSEVDLFVEDALADVLAELEAAAETADKAA